MKSVFQLLAACVILACALNCSSRREKEYIFRNPERAMQMNIGQFSRSDTIRMFDKNSLWKYIDGAADKFIDFGFDKLAVADYKLDTLELTAEIYAFSSGSGARKFYLENKTAYEKTINLGDDAFITPGLLFYYRKNIFMQVNCYNFGAGDDPLIHLSRAIDSILTSLAVPK